MKHILYNLLVIMLLSVSLTAAAETYEAEKNSVYGPGQRLADDTASEGAALIYHTGEQAGLFMVAQYFFTPPGHYKTIWRLKAADNKNPKALVRLTCTQPGGEPYTLNSLVLKGVDFTAPNQWQDFTVEYDRGELGGTAFLANAEGGGEVALDKVTCEKVRDLTEKELYDLALKVNPLTPPADPTALWRSARDRAVDVLNLQDMTWEDSWGVKAAAERLPGARYTVHPWTQVWHKAFVPGVYFPTDDATLDKYDVVVLSCGDARKLLATGREMLRRYVKQGGGLIILGGYQSFGKGRLQGSVLEELLPVQVGDPWDLTALTDGRITVTPQAPAAFRLPANWPARAAWAHRAQPKPEAVVLWKCGDIPAAVAWRYGAGRVVAILLSPLGPIKPTAPYFTDDPAWPDLFARILAWTAEPGVAQ